MCNTFSRVCRLVKSCESIFLECVSLIPRFSTDDCLYLGLWSFSFAHMSIHCDWVHIYSACVVLRKARWIIYFDRVWFSTLKKTTFSSHLSWAFRLHDSIVKSLALKSVINDDLIQHRICRGLKLRAPKLAHYGPHHHFLLIPLRLCVSGQMGVLNA